MTIKHIVISGGSVYGFMYYGILKELLQQKMLHLSDIKTIHATSVGCIIGILVSLSLPWEDLDKYLISRPWQDVFQFSFLSLVNCFSTNGIFTKDAIQSIFLPVFNAKDIDITITMLEFYTLFHIELHFFTVAVSEFQVIDLSYKTHPHWTVVECVYASCCVPILFQPFAKEGIIYTDGGFLCNCPIQQLMNDQDIGIGKEVLCINIDSSSKLTSDYNLFSYLFVIFSNMIHNKHSFFVDKVHYICVKQTNIHIFDIGTICSSSEERKRLIACGKDIGLDFIEKLKEKEHQEEQEKKDMVEVD